jgi:hypothetical protein
MPFLIKYGENTVLSYRLNAAYKFDVFTTLTLSSIEACQCIFNRVIANKNAVQIRAPFL